MRAAVLAAALLVAAPAWAGQGYFGVGPSLDLGILLGPLVTRWGPDNAMLDIAGSTGLSCFGGKYFHGGRQRVRASIEGSYCRDLSWQIEAEWSYFGASLGKDFPIGAGRIAGFQVGVGLGQGAEFLYAYKQHDVYLRPRVYLTLPMGHTAAEVAAYLHLPLLYSQRMDGKPGGVGFTPWLGVESTFYFGRFARAVHPAKPSVEHPESEHPIEPAPAPAPAEPAPAEPPP